MNTHLNLTCLEKQCNLTRAEIVTLYNFFKQSLEKDGYSKTFSLLTYDNLEGLEYVIEIIDKMSPDVTKTSEYRACEAEFEKILEKFGDRDAQGKLIRDENGTIIITEQSIEFENAQKEFYEKHKNIKARAENNANLIAQYMAEKMDVMLVVMDKFEDYPDNLPPCIVQILDKLY